MQKLSTEEKLDVYRKFLSYHVPCVIFSRDLEPEPEFLKIATENDTPVLSTDYGTSAFMAELIYYLGEVLAPCISIHGVLVDVYGEGLLIMGEKRKARTVTLKQNEINKYFTPDYDEQKMRSVIIELLEEWSNKNK